MPAQFDEIQLAVGDKRRHAGRAFGAGNRNAVDARFGDAGECHHRGGDFGRRHVLALPAKGVADAVDKIEESACIHAHQIAGAVPGIADFEHIAQNFALGVRGAGIALELAAGLAAASPMRPIASPVSPVAQRMQRPFASRAGSPAAASNLTSASGKRWVRNGGTRPMAPTLPSTL